MTPLISVRGAKKHFPIRRRMFSRAPQRYVRAVDGVDIELVEHETLALVGESGSGKTTLGTMVLGLTKPSEGTIEWNGRSLWEADKAGWQAFRRDVQVVFQDPYGSLNPRMTVRDIIGRPLRLHRIVPDDELDREVARLLELVGLRPADSYIDRFPHEFSGGQRQRIAIARALSLRPRIIVADEPVSALDVSIRAQILQLLTDLKRDVGIAMLFTTHDLGVVRYIADRVAVMYLGKVVEIAPADAFFANTNHPYSRMLLGSALSPDPSVGLTRRGPEVEGEPPSPINPPSGCRFRTRCPHAFERCAAEEPPLMDLGGGHRAACWLNTEAAPERQAAA